MAETKLEGNTIHTNGDLPHVGSPAPDFNLTGKDLNDVSLADFGDKRKLIYIVPSLDTPVCAESTKKINQFVEQRPDVHALIVSADLPFAMDRFCSVEGLERVTVLSMMRDRNFAKDYGVLIQDGPLAGITARAMLVLDADNLVMHAQLVPEIGDEPDYDAVFAALDDRATLSPTQ
ncbi:thiol peroxidase, atypical 2-Cys peroxiredoxin [Thioalkalivibrio sp. ALE21]|uniref:thiol peroxidase n=1 Tax=Thioalkalivibrio sp. ALE21 TaxID=1158175 RepID=UPI000D84D79D|nr:thiol peroxidase [Thioalkalivibrio sp. ALE21]PYG02508.1 thiol peroxidase, atypical 2-Cys peroxiredoxin [Thioalkalivibrio sp. ALE21]